MARPILILILIWHAIATIGQRIEVVKEEIPFKDGSIEIVAEGLPPVNLSENVQDPLAVLFGLEPASVLSESALYNRHKFLNISELEKKLEFPRNYGLSTVLSSDVLGLKRAIENLADSKCKNQSLQLVRGMFTGKEWALKMYDASAKSPNGLLWGATFQLGNFDECISVGDETENTHVVGQYCLANVHFNKKSIGDGKNVNVSTRLGPREDIHWAVCVPSSCSSEQVQDFISDLLTSSGNGGKARVSPENCYTNKPLEVDVLDIAFGAFLIGFTIILISCTFYHLYFYIRNKNADKKEKTIVESVIISFSITENLKKIFSTKQQNDIGLNSIAGIRTLSMLLILAGHTLLFIIGGPVMNTMFYDDMIVRVENSLMVNNTLLVDTFLFISAFLFARLLMAELDKRKGKVNFLAIFIFRYIRVTSSYLIVLLMYMTWFVKFGKGPLWNIKVEEERRRCLKSWWTNVLYVNNYVQTDDMCMFQSWYVAADTQLFFLAPFIIYPLWRWRRFGECLLGLTTIVTTIIPFIITYRNNLDPTFLPFSKEISDISQNYYFKEVYIKTHMKANAYCAGLAFGYILYRIQTSNYKLNKKVLIAGWTTSVIFATSAIFGISVFFQHNHIYNTFEAAIYNSLHHIAWAFGTGWLLIVCATKNGGFVNSIFSWKPFIPISRLTYCAYLVNGFIELYSQGILRNSIYISIYEMTVLSFSRTFQTFIAAIILCVMFESPLHGIEKILMKSAGKKKNNEEVVEDDVKSKYNKNDEKF